MEIRVCAPSYKRSKRVETDKYIPFIRLYVDPSEYREYGYHNPGLTIIKCGSGVQGNLARVRNYVIKIEFEDGADVVCIVDDDMKGIYYWEKEDMVKGRLLKTNEILCFIEKYSIMAKEIGAYYWGINVNKDPQIYREYTPFSTVSYIGSPFSCFLKGNNCWYDERFPLKEDYDMTIQQLNKNRVVFRVNKFYYQVRQGQQQGGCATYRNLEEEHRQVLLLQKKWGKRIVRWDRQERCHKLKKVKRHIDRNPVIRVPIRGI